MSPLDEFSPPIKMDCSQTQEHLRLKLDARQRPFRKDIAQIFSTFEDIRETQSLF